MFLWEILFFLPVKEFLSISRRFHMGRFYLWPCSGTRNWHRLYLVLIQLLFFAVAQVSLSHILSAQNATGVQHIPAIGLSSTFQAVRSSSCFRPNCFNFHKMKNFLLTFWQILAVSLFIEDHLLFLLQERWYYPLIWVYFHLVGGYLAQCIYWRNWK